MPVFGERFVYSKKELSEGEVRVARTRAESALWGRQQARRFAEARKRLRQTAGGEVAAEALPPPKEKDIVTVMNDGPPVVEERPVVTEPRAAGQEEGEVRRSLYLPAGFLAHLMGQEEFFLHYLRGHYEVSIFVAVPKKRIHMKGPRSNVVACYECMKELLVRWHQRQAGDL